MKILHSRSTLLPMVLCLSLHLQKLRNTSETPDIYPVTMTKGLEAWPNNCFMLSCHTKSNLFEPAGNTVLVRRSKLLQPCLEGRTRKLSKMHSHKVLFATNSHTRHNKAAPDAAHVLVRQTSAGTLLVLGYGDPLSLQQPCLGFHAFHCILVQLMSSAVNGCVNA